MKVSSTCSQKFIRYTETFVSVTKLCSGCPQFKDESLRTYLKRFQAELAEVEKPDGKLAIMTFKQGLYVHSPLSQKLNKGKHDYATLAEFFDIIDALTD